MPVNVKLTNGNFSFGPLPGFFYSVNRQINALIQVEADGTIINTFPIANSQLRNPVKELHYDGTFFWTLEDLPSNLGIVIKKWRLFPFKTFVFPSVTPIELRWQDELTLIHGPSIRWGVNAFAVEHYHRTFANSATRGDSVIRLNSVSQINAGDRLYLGPSTFTGFAGNEEVITVGGVDSGTGDVFFSKVGGLENSYIGNDPVDLHKSVFVFNDHSFTGQENDLGSLVQFSWPGKTITRTDQGAKYAKVNAADFDLTDLSWVRATQILRLDIFSPTFDLASSLEANLLESDLTTIIPVSDLIADLNDNLYYKLQQKETTENIGTGSFTTTDFSPNYNFQTQSILPIVNSTALSFDTRFTRPFATADKININAHIFDQFNFPVLGKSVQFSAAINELSTPGIIGTFSPVINVTNVSGIASTQYSPSATVDEILVDITAAVL